MAASAGTFVLAHTGSGTTATTGSLGTSTVGDVLFASSTDGNAGTDPTGSDNKSNTGWGQLGTAQIEGTTGSRMTVLYTQNIANAGASQSVTVTYASGNNISLIGGFITGTAGANAVDTGSLAQTIDTATPFTLSSNAPAQTDNYWITWFGIDDTGTTESYTQPSGYALLQNTSDHNTSYVHAVAGVAKVSGSAESITWANQYSTGQRSLKIVAVKSQVASPTITQQPQDQRVDAGATATFTVGTSGSPTYQWQVSIGGGAFSNVTDGTGGTTASYTTAATTQAYQGRRYRCVVTEGSSLNSNDAGLTVLGFPVYLWATDVQSGNDVWLRDPLTGSAGAYTLSIDPATYTVTAAAETLTADRALSVDPASYTLTAAAETLSVGRALSFDPASYSLTAAAESFYLTRALSIDPASYAVTTSAVTLSVGRALSVDPQSYTLTTSAETLSVGRALSFDPATYTLTTSPESFYLTRVLSVDPASYSLTAANEALTVARNLSIDPASYTLSASNETLSVGRVLSVDPASYVISAADITLTYTSTALELSIDPASYALTAAPVTLTATRSLSIDPAAYSLTTAAVTLSVGRQVNVDAASYAITASPVTLQAARALSIDPVAYSLTPADIELTYESVNKVLSVDPVAYVLSAADVSFEYTSTSSGGNAPVSPLVREAREQVKRHEAKRKKAKEDAERKAAEEAKEAQEAEERRIVEQAQAEREAVAQALRDIQSRSKVAELPPKPEEPDSPVISEPAARPVPPKPDATEVIALVDAEVKARADAKAKENRKRAAILAALLMMAE